MAESASRRARKSPTPGSPGFGWNRSVGGGPGAAAPAPPSFQTLTGAVRWCRDRELNPDELALTAPSKQRVYHFTTSARRGNLNQSGWAWQGVALGTIAAWWIQ